MLTPEEITKKSDAALLAQGELARDDAGCFYAKPLLNDRRCGVGILLDQFAANQLEYVYNLGSVRRYTNHVYKGKIKELFSKNGIDIDDPATMQALIDIQVRHDKAKDFEKWKAGVK